MGWGYHWSLSFTEPLTILNDIFHQGADINTQDVNGDTCLHWTPLLTSQIVKWFTGHGADLNISNKAGFTPLQKTITLIKQN